MIISNFLEKKELVDTGSSLDVLHQHTSAWLGLKQNYLQFCNFPIISFSRKFTKPKGQISLQVQIRDPPKEQIIFTTTFEVVSCPSTDDAVIGLPTLNRLKAVISTYHLKVKFPTPRGVGELKGKQNIA